MRGLQSKGIQMGGHNNAKNQPLSPSHFPESKQITLHGARKVRPMPMFYGKKETQRVRN